MTYSLKSLGDFFSFRKGLGYQGKYLEPSNVALIGLNSFIGGGGYKFGGEKEYAGPYKAEHLALPGDLFISTTDITQDGRVLASPFLLPDLSDKFQAVIFSHHIVKAVPRNDKLLPEFLYNILRAKAFRERAAYASTGSTVRSIPVEVLEELDIPVPPKSIQVAIVRQIQLFDQMIETNSRISECFEQIARTVFTSWFVDFDPVDANSRGEKIYISDPEITNLFPSTFEESEIGPIPTGWTVGPISQIFTLQGGYSFKSKDWLDDGVPVVKIGSVKPGFVDLSSGSCVAQELAERIPLKYWLPTGSLVVGLSGYVGEVGLVPNAEVTPLLNQRVAKFGLVNSDWKIPFAYCLTRDAKFKREVVASATGSAQANVSISDILAIKRAIPPSKLIERFDTLFGSIFEQMLSLREQNTKLAEIRDALLPRLLTGDIPIPEKSQED